MVPEKAPGGKGREAWAGERAIEHHSCGGTAGLWDSGSTVAQIRVSVSCLFSNQTVSTLAWAQWGPELGLVESE